MAKQLRKAKSVEFEGAEMRALKKFIRSKKFNIAAANAMDVNIRSLERLMKNKRCSPDIKAKILPFLNLN